MVITKLSIFLKVSYLLYPRKVSSAPSPVKATVTCFRATLLNNILNTAESFIVVGTKEVKKVALLRGKTVVSLFFESSTRTRNNFELAAKHLSADVLNVDILTSSASKEESLLDTLRNLRAMRNPPI